MVQGMSRDAWDEFSKTILERFVLSYLCGTLYLGLGFCVIKEDLCILCGDLFSLSIHALTCLSRYYI